MGSPVTITPDPQPQNAPVTITPDAPKEQKENALVRFAKNFDQTVAGTDNPSDILHGIGLALAHPHLLSDSIKEMAKGAIKSHVDLGNRALDELKRGNIVEGGTHLALSGVPFVGPAIAHAGDQAASGDLAGAGGTVTGVVAPLVAAHPSTAAAATDAANAVKNVRPPLKGVLADKMAEVPAGEQFTRQQVLDAARTNGVNLDLAQATDSPKVNAVKRGNRYSIAAENSYDTNSTHSLQKLEEWANNEASKYSPEPMSKEAAGAAIQSELEKQRTAGDQRNATSLSRDTSEQLQRFPAESQPREVVGQRLQASLKKNLQVRQDAAAQLFADVEKNAGTQKVDTSSTLQDAARNIIDQNKDYYVKNQSLLPGRAWGIVNDLASQRTASITDLQRLRSDLMNEYRSPDIAGSRAEGWLKQLAGAADNAMTQAGNGLTGENLAKWRQANSVWESIKTTYDNPQSPMYHAIRSGSPSQVVSSMEALPPEYTRGLQGSIDKDTFTLFQKSYLERLLDPKSSGATDFAGLEKRVSNMGDAKLQAVFGDHAPAIKRFSQRATDIANAEPFGDASSPLNKATDARNPLDVVKTLSGGGPELARQVQATIGGLKGQFQRQFVENLLNDKNGNLELGRLSQKLKAIPQDHLEAMIGKEGADNLKLLAAVSRKVLADSNPSGTAKSGIPRAEMAGIGTSVGAAALGHPELLVGQAAELGAQYGIGKAINSKKVIDYLTKKH